MLLPLFWSNWPLYPICGQWRWLPRDYDLILILVDLPVPASPRPWTRIGVVAPPYSSSLCCLPSPDLLAARLAWIALIPNCQGASPTEKSSRVSLRIQIGKGNWERERENFWVEINAFMPSTGEINPFILIFLQFKWKVLTIGPVITQEMSLLIANSQLLETEID